MAGIVISAVQSLLNSSSTVDLSSQFVKLFIRSLMLLLQLLYIRYLPLPCGLTLLGMAASRVRNVVYHDPRFQSRSRQRRR